MLRACARNHCNCTHVAAPSWPSGVIHSKRPSRRLPSTFIIYVYAPVCTRVCEGVRECEWTARARAFHYIFFIGNSGRERENERRKRRRRRRLVEGIGKILRTMLDKTRERMIMVCYHWGRRKGFVYRLSNDRRKIEGFDAI